MENVIDRETAESDFERFCEAMDLDVDTSGMDEEEIKALGDLRRLFVKRVMSGALVVGDDGALTFSPSSGGSDIVFAEPTSRALTAVDAKKKNQDVGKLIAIMAAMTKQPEKRFLDMPMRDFKVCKAIVSLFLG